MGFTNRYPVTVQRLFSMFPDGGPGAGLLLLRLAVALSLLSDATDGTLEHALLGLPVLALCLGILTPVFAAGCCLLKLHSLLITGGASLPEAAISLLAAGALVLLGPGAHSLDARLFGRRVITLPPRK